MGTQVGRIEKEFVFKTLIDEKIPIEIHGDKKEYTGIVIEADEEKIILEGKTKSLEDFTNGEEVRAFFYLKNNYHTFNATVIKNEGERLIITHPQGIYKNLQRKYERIKMPEGINVSFVLKGKKIELNFPKTSGYQSVEEPPKYSDNFDPKRLDKLVKEFKTKMGNIVNENKINMFREKVPRSYEEKLIVRTNKSLWIPSTEEDFPLKDPFSVETVIVKLDLIKYEESLGTPPYIITSKLANILYEKNKKGIYSELYTPILYNEYVVGYIYLMNNTENKKQIDKETVEYVVEFSKVLCYSLKINGYFKAETSGEKKFEAPIIDMSASGILFSHPSSTLGKELLIHTDIDLIIKIKNRTMKIGGRVMRKFKDGDMYYFGVQFLRITPEDFRFLFEYLYGKPFTPEYEDKWEGGAPPPPLDIFGDKQ